MTTTAMEPREEGTIFGHPKGLAFLFFTEMWERFSFYGMLSLLTLYMVNFLFIQPDVGQKVLGFLWVKHLFQPGKFVAQPLASHVFGLYTGFVYLTPFVGGLLADRVLGRRRTVILGAILMAIGHFLMAAQSMFFLALMFLILGNGAFKPNISTQVGGLYKQGDPRRDRAFSIFYVGINIGAFFSPLICGTLGQTVGWHWGFGAAGVGMIVGLIIYLCGQRYLPAIEKTAGPSSRPAGIWATVFGYIVVTPLLIAALMLLQSSPAYVIWPVAGVVAAAVVGWMLTLRGEERGPVVALCVLCFCTIFFWATYTQQGNAVQLWADRYTDLRIVKNSDARPVRVADRGDEKPETIAALEAVAKTRLSSDEALAAAGGQYYAVKGAVVDDYRVVDQKRARLKAELTQVKNGLDVISALHTRKDGVDSATRKSTLETQAAALDAKITGLDHQVQRLVGWQMPDGVLIWIAWLIGLAVGVGVFLGIRPTLASRSAPPGDWAVWGGVAVASVAAIGYGTWLVLGFMNDLGWVMPSTWFQSFNPFLIFALTPVVVRLWTRQARKKREPGTVVKMAIGCLLVGVSYLVLVGSAGVAGSAFKTGLWWLFGFSLVVTLGELYLSPIGLSLVTKLAPARMVSMLMGVWFLATFIGNYMAGSIGTLFNERPKPIFWAISAIIAAATALLIFLLHKPVQKAMGGAEAAADV